MYIVLRTQICRDLEKVWSGYEFVLVLCGCEYVIVVFRRWDLKVETVVEAQDAMVEVLLQDHLKMEVAVFAEAAAAVEMETAANFTLEI